MLILTSIILHQIYYKKSTVFFPSHSGGQNCRHFLKCEYFEFNTYKNCCTSHGAMNHILNERKFNSEFKKKSQIFAFETKLCYFQSDKEAQTCEIQEMYSGNNYYQLIRICILGSNYQL